MIKGIFLLGKLVEKKAQQIIELGANTVFIGHQNLDQKLVEKLRGKSIKVYTEVDIFVGEEWWKKYPDSRPVAKNGRLMDKIHSYASVCPNHPEVRKEKLQLIKSLVDNQNIDGIWLDFIRYPCHWEEVRNNKITEYCFCQNCREQFQHEVGGEPAGKRWTAWRCRQITEFVAEVRALIKQSGKNLKLGMFSVPWREKDFSGAVTKIIGQDFGDLARWVDVFSPMVYHKMCGKPTKWINEIVACMAQATGKPILPIVQEEINQALKPSSAGVVIFFLEDLLKNSDKLRIVKEIFK